MAYFIIQDDQTKGPYTMGQLRSMWNAGAITVDTLYCEEGFEDWLHLRVLAEEIEGSMHLPASLDYGSSSRAASVVLVKHTKSRGAYIILGLFFGLLGIHNF